MDETLKPVAERLATCPWTEQNGVRWRNVPEDIFCEAVALLRSEPVGEPVASNYLRVLSWECYTCGKVFDGPDAMSSSCDRGDCPHTRVRPRIYYAAPPAAPEAQGAPVAWDGFCDDPDCDAIGVLLHSPVDDVECECGRPLIWHPLIHPSAPEAQDWQKPEVAQPDVFRWDESVEQIHRELAGEVAPPEAQEPERWIGVGWGGVRYFNNEDKALTWAREEAACCPYLGRVGDIHIPVHRILVDRTVVPPPSAPTEGGKPEDDSDLPSAEDVKGILRPETSQEGASPSDPFAGRERDHLSFLREHISHAYRDHPTGCGGSFEELLCWEIHENGLTFRWLAEKWGVSLPTLGELIWDHCKGLEALPVVNHEYRIGVLPTPPEPTVPTVSAASEEAE